MGDLALAMCGGYGAAEARTFLRSLRAAGFGGDIVLFLHRNPPGTAQALRSEGATVVEPPLEGVPETYSYNVARYRLFAEHLRHAVAERVLLSDLRDVAFQADPFSPCEGDAVHLFLEHPSKPIGRCIWTSSWLRYRYGDAALPPLAARPVVCSGVALGAARAVRDYLECVLAELTPPLRSTNYMAGYDQGVVNLLCHQGRIPSLVLHPWERSPVLHLGNAPAGLVRTDELGRVLNAAGEVVRAVHHYDRHPEIARALARRWEAPGEAP